MHQVVGLGAEIGAAGFGGLFQPGGNMDRGAEEVLARGPLAMREQCDLAMMDTDAHAGFRISDMTQDFQRGEAGADRVILAGAGGAEHRQDAVAARTDRAAVTLRRFRHGGDQRIEQIGGCFGIEVCDEFGGAGDVGEHHSDAALFPVGRMRIEDGSDTGRQGQVLRSILVRISQTDSRDVMPRLLAYPIQPVGSNVRAFSPWVETVIAW